MKVAQHGRAGFTLLELLVVITLVGILAAIAIPRFAEYRGRGFDTRALSDLRNIALAQEAYFIDQEEYLPCDNAGCEQLPGVGRLSRGTEVHVTVTAQGFRGVASHPRGTGRNYTWDSELGGLQE